jgi:Tfp pilus assembly protein PilF
MQDIPSLMAGAETLRAAEKFSQAEASYRRVLALAPGNAAAWRGLGRMAVTTGQYEAGASLLAKAIRCAPTDPDRYAEFGACLGRMNRWELSVEANCEALRLAPDHYCALTELGRALCKLNRVEEAIPRLRQAVKLRPDLPAAHGILGLALLVSGQMPEGWDEYEWRLKITPKLVPKLNRPRWNGEHAPNETILLWPEQGAGDCVQFLRYAPLVKARVGRVILCCPENLVRLAQTAEGLDAVVAQSGPAPAYDRYALLTSLPGVFRTTLDSVPGRTPYLRAPALAPAGAAVNPAPGRLRVGLVWAGSPAHVDDAHRSIPLVRLAPLLATSGVQFYSLQVGSRAADAGRLERCSSLIGWSGRLQDYSDTAAALTQLDLLITVDTSAAHLAGALGRPVWVLLPFAPDWRWLLRGQTSPWYPTMRLFRQTRAGDWDGAIAEVTMALSEKAKGRNRAGQNY